MTLPQEHFDLIERAAVSKPPRRVNNPRSVRGAIDVRHPLNPFTAKRGASTTISLVEYCMGSFDRNPYVSPIYCYATCFKYKCGQTRTTSQPRMKALGSLRLRQMTHLEHPCHPGSSTFMYLVAATDVPPCRPQSIKNSSCSAARSPGSLKHLRSNYPTLPRWNPLSLHPASHFKLAHGRHLFDKNQHLQPVN